MKFRVIKNETTSVEHEVDADTPGMAERKVRRGEGLVIARYATTVNKCYATGLFKCETCKLKYPEYFESLTKRGNCKWCSGEQKENK